MIQIGTLGELDGNARCLQALLDGATQDFCMGAKGSAAIIGNDGVESSRRQSLCKFKSGSLFLLGHTGIWCEAMTGAVDSPALRRT